MRLLKNWGHCSILAGRILLLCHFKPREDKLAVFLPSWLEFAYYSQLILFHSLSLYF